MPINYATKYATKVAERFKLGSITDADCGHEYTWTSPNSKTIKVGSVNTVPETEYQRSGDARFGETYDVGDTLQEMTCTQAPAFSFTIDALDGTDQAIEKSAARALRRQLDEVTVPGMDKYRIKKWCMGANVVMLQAAEPTKATIAEMIIDANAAMTDKLVPLAGRTIYIATKYYKLLKQNPDYLGVESLGKEALTKGVVGEFDGAKVKPVPSSYMPKGVYFMIKYKGSTVDPVKLQQYDILPKVKGFSGPVVQGVTYYDAFVLGTKGDGVAVCGSADFILAAPAITVSDSTHKATVAAVAGVEFHYTTDGTNPRYSDSAKVYTGAVDLAQGETIKVVGFKDGAVGILAEAEYK